ncbi:uncharacterized protein SPPG_09484 [Spizellomyces punctatus DAOM BR117]|uniref:Uncharacterized protein n=1 Tax=Spizellomyces punctatus (strain DAOM BR117) TaxID=645134 RepID=A0A0L0H9A6_SPIPD|nr:uncharacterized protein SPPG_09484 [Spizellomyces punctatus DAOM BR117]KNC97243.1 hypothetical protein SPPG_09484 [Spizellomyces punctatus DAOM BR117]|eukprot:XP_016605283.1 hypothetical protein SPPG_09484 [Spizellomyces punctatus DAOM BR117]
MSFSWTAIDERERSKAERDRQLKDFLKAQQAETKDRKLKHRQNEVEEYQKLLGVRNVKSRPSDGNISNAPQLGRERETMPLSDARQQIDKSSASALPVPNHATNLPASTSLLAISPSLPSVSPMPDFQTPLKGSVSFDLESQLAQERRLRTHLEYELQTGKTLLASLSAKMDKLSSSVASSQVSLHDISRQAADADRRSRDLESSISALGNYNAGNTRQIIAEVVSKQQRHEEQIREEENTRHRGVTESERAEREKAFTYLAEKLRIMEHAYTQDIEKIKNRLQRMEATMSEEQSRRAETAAIWKRTHEETSQALHHSLNKVAEEVRQQQGDLKERLSSAVKGMEQSIKLIGQATDQRVESMEEVLRAEIKSRMENHENTNTAILSLKSVIEETEKSLSDRMHKHEADARVIEGKLQTELSQTANQLSQSKTRALDDMESQISALRKRMHNFEVELKAQSDSCNANLSRGQEECTIRLQEAETRLESHINGLRKVQDQCKEAMSEVDARVTDFTAKFEERIKIKAVQLDQTLEAFKKDLSVRLTQKEVEELEKRIRIAFDTRLSRIDEMLNASSQSNEEMATKLDMENIEKRFKKVLVDVQTRELEIIEHIANVKKEMNCFNTRNEMIEVEKRLTSQLESRHTENQASIAAINKAITTTASKRETEAQFHSRIIAMEEELAIMKQAIETSKEYTKRLIDDGITSSSVRTKEDIEAVRTRLSDISIRFDAIDSRLSTTDAHIRTIIHKHTEEQNQAITNQATSLDKLRETTNDQIHAVGTRIKELNFKVQELRDADALSRGEVREELQGHIDRLAHNISEIRTALHNRLQQSTFEDWESNLRSELRALRAHLDADFITNDRLRGLLTDEEAVARDRHKELRSMQERSLAEQIQIMKQWRDTVYKRLDILEKQRVDLKATEEGSGIDTVRLEQNLDEMATGINRRIDGDIQKLREEMYAMERGLYDALRVQIERISRSVEDRADHALPASRRGTEHNTREQDEPKATAAEGAGHTSGDPDTTSIAPATIMVPGSFFKPPHLSFSSTAPTSVAISPSAHTPDSRKLNQQSADDPQFTPQAILTTQSIPVLQSPRSSINSTAAPELISAGTSMTDLRARYPLAPAQKRSSGPRDKQMTPRTVSVADELERLADLAAASQELRSGGSVVTLPGRCS